MRRGRSGKPEMLTIGKDSPGGSQRRPPWSLERASRSTRWEATTRRRRSSPARCLPRGSSTSRFCWSETKRAFARFCADPARERVRVVHAPEAIAMDLSPSTAVRSCDAHLARRRGQSRQARRGRCRRFGRQQRRVPRDRVDQAAHDRRDLASGDCDRLAGAQRTDRFARFRRERRLPPGVARAVRRSWARPTRKPC